jgi:hypothetical protein
MMSCRVFFFLILSTVVLAFVLVAGTFRPSTVPKNPDAPRIVSGP